MKYLLVMKTNDGGERPFPIKQRVIIGRATQCEIRIALPVVSNQHCELRVEAGQLLLKDLDSEHGTYHNGNRVSKARINHNDELTIGPVTFCARIEQMHDMPQTQATVDLPEIKTIANRSKSPRPS
jgi:pSer/pThr/pTyr-binding forkhead associated (FHA) protein